MKLINKIHIKKLNTQKVNFITIDGITCCGKSLFANLLKKNLKRKFKNIFILNKDLFLLTREKRIKITKKMKNVSYFNQNEMHYDLKKLRILIKFLNYGNKNNNLVLKNLYNRKTGKNDLKLKFIFNSKRLVIFEGIYVNQDLKNILVPILKILLIEKVYNSLGRKIERIRDKKISIQHVVNEFTKIHLQSFKKYLISNFFDITYKDINENFIKIRNGRIKQLINIKLFLSKHLY